MNVEHHVIEKENLLDEVNNKTYWSNNYKEKVIKAVKKLIVDEDRNLRLNKRQCATCFYLRSPRIGGAVMTKANCMICNEKTMYSSTAVDRVCVACSKEYGLCVTCAGDIELKKRKKIGG